MPWRARLVQIIGLMFALAGCSNTVHCGLCPGYYFYADVPLALASRAHSLDVCPQDHPCVTQPWDDPRYGTVTYKDTLAMLGINGVPVYEGAIDLAVKDQSGNEVISATFMSGSRVRNG